MAAGCPSHSPPHSPRLPRRGAPGPLGARQRGSRPWKMPRRGAPRPPPSGRRLLLVRPAGRAAKEGGQRAAPPSSSPSAVVRPRSAAVRAGSAQGAPPTAPRRAELERRGGGAADPAALSGRPRAPRADRPAGPSPLRALAALVPHARVAAVAQ
ncbi:translation initiation factor IF-2-like [Panicum virgatum]|uniref:translation initiation factor IF-2-like n=1 Tax=Panicum virgatum TaxID=38727 RepID=UPI0019D59F3F|nr:translation initiation factor IF-2-like [Panicum virgatum]